jgi:y4mF family transcriptional regulator
MSTEKLTQFVKERRKMVGMTQLELSQRSGTGLRFIRELEQGKTTLRLDKVNQVLALFGHEMAPVKIERGGK